MNRSDGVPKILEPYNAFMVQLCKDLFARGTELSEGELQLAVTQIASACFMVVLVPNLNVPDFNIDLRDDEIRKHFVTQLFEKLIK